MQSNPLHFLTDRQLRALAGLEGLTVPQILSKYRNFRTKEETEVRRKAPETNAVKAMKLLPSGQASSLQEAWDLVRGRKVVRGRQLGNPIGGFGPHTPGSVAEAEAILSMAECRLRIAFVDTYGSGPLQKRLLSEPAYDTAEAAYRAAVAKLRAAEILAASSARKNPRKGRARSPYRRNGGGAAEAMRLYHSGQASSLKEAWDIVKGGRR